ncbi:MAG: NAD(P)/FAD-dependent oxidoreductase [Flavobacteriales bacterium]|nr:NAD(P)/FAD-dependent oxidoreductase [Flavobacteriales bacterium]
MKVAVIGGGAAGFFAAIRVKEVHPEADVTIFEKSKKILAKVKVSGGGRCNVTNSETNIKTLAQAYPRGEKFLRKAFGKFNTAHTIEWFESRGVPLVTQSDNCIFPESQDSQSVIDCFLMIASKQDVKIEFSTTIRSISENDNSLTLTIGEDSHLFDKVIVATGGSPKRSGLEWLESLGHSIIDPVPSLFTFNMPDEAITSLMGIVVENALVNVQGTKLKSSGPLLITHWGMSGPAILILSAFGARILSERNYSCVAQVNWVGELNSELVKQEIEKIINDNPNKLVANYRPYALQDRLWQYFITKCEFPKDHRWSNLGRKGINKLVNCLTNDTYEVSGKTTFKEEFVTCGGISLNDIDVKTMQSKVTPNLYFCGEVMDIDGITGGYNFQAAWTTGYIAGELG